jgi:hypothetical protein
MQQVAQSSHAIEQAIQASMQFLEFFILFDYLIFFFSSAVARPSVMLLPEYFE